MEITVIGSGYVGLVTGACLADLGNDVICLDIDQRKTNLLQQGGVPIYEPDLAALVKANVTAGRLNFTTDVNKSVEQVWCRLLQWAHPSGEDGSADLQHVQLAKP